MVINWKRECSFEFLHESFWVNESSGAIMITLNLLRGDDLAPAA